MRGLRESRIRRVPFSFGDLSLAGFDFSSFQLGLEKSRGFIGDGEVDEILKADLLLPESVFKALATSPSHSRAIGPFPRNRHASTNTSTSRGRRRVSNETKTTRTLLVCSHQSVSTMTSVDTVSGDSFSVCRKSHTFAFRMYSFNSGRADCSRLSSSRVNGEASRGFRSLEMRRRLWVRRCWWGVGGMVFLSFHPLPPSVCFLRDSCVLAPEGRVDTYRDRF